MHSLKNHQIWQKGRKTRNSSTKYPYTFLFHKKNNNDGKNDLDGESKYYFDVKNIAAAYYIMPVIFRDQIPMYVHFFWTAFCPFNSWYFHCII